VDEARERIGGNLCGGVSLSLRTGTRQVVASERAKNSMLRKIVS
jgi:hypothetical protein